MTISDAIKHLSYKIAYYKGSVSKHADDVLVEALELAVIALEELKEQEKLKLQCQMNKVSAASLEWNIPLDDFFEIIEHRFMRESYIVHLKYRYEHELNFTYSVEVLENEDGHFVWLNDWDEGQTHVYVVNAVPLAEVFDYNIVNDRALLKILKEGTK